MAAIDIDFDVFKELTARRKTENMTENEVIRELLGFSANGSTTNGADTVANDSSSPWVAKGVTFPEGTEFRATYKGQQFNGTVKNAALVLSGKRYTSPSAAAVEITGHPVNGWRFWECLRPGTNKWKLIAGLRQ